MEDIEANTSTLTRDIQGKKVCVIGGARSIGSGFIMVRQARHEDLKEQDLRKLICQ